MKKLPLLFAAILTALLFTLPVYAADITLSSRCTLADAIIAANNDRAEGGCLAGRGADTITLTRDITLDGGLPKITSDITVEGNGYAISGGNRYRIFYNGGALTINDLTMIKGYVEGDLISNADGSTLKATTANPIGGAIVNWAGTITISDSAFSGNSAKWGGAIANWAGTIIISDSTFSLNLAEWGGAIHNGGWADEDLNIGGELSITNSTFSDNSAADRSGAINNFGELSIGSSTFSDNSAWDGGAIGSLGELSISSSTFSDNSADGLGGAVVNWVGELSIGSSTFSHNSADGFGGAVYNYGAAYNYEDGEKSIVNRGELSIVNSTFSHNSAEDGGAIVNGGGGELSNISSSTFSHNSADTEGGAIVNGGELSIVNSAFSDNSAEDGGAIYNREESDLSIVNSTFSHNSADSVGGAIYNNEGMLSIFNSIIAGNGGACYSGNRLKQNIRNFIQGGSCPLAFRGDPKLGELVEPEDGSPSYFPLLAGSRAIDAADDAYCPETDQVGTVRPQGAGCDIGAIEYVTP